MDTSSDNGLHLGGAAKRIAQRMLVIFENRFQLLMVEVQAERERALLALWLALGGGGIWFAGGRNLHHCDCRRFVGALPHYCAAGAGRALHHGHRVFLPATHPPPAALANSSGNPGPIKKGSRMPGKNFHLTPLESRRQLLLVESELNRAQLLDELRDLKNEIHHLQGQVQAIGSVASSAAKLATTFSAIRSAFKHRDSSEKKSSWISTLLKRARTGVLIWGALRSHRK